MDEHYKEAAELSDLVDRCFGADSYLSDLTINAVEAAAELGAETTAALEYGLRPHLDALVAGTETADREQLVNYLRYFELTAARLKVTDHKDPLGRVERDFNTDPHIREGVRLRIMAKLEESHGNQPDEQSSEGPTNAD
jgi:hypothetical protein